VKKPLIYFLFLICITILLGAYFSYKEYAKISSDNPLVWEQAIVELENRTNKAKPSRDAVLFVGSSSIRFWDTLMQDMHPLPVIQHGFGGSKIYDVVYYAERLITKWNPSKVVIFVGSNDINGNDQHQLAPAHIAEQLRILLGVIFSANADTEVFYISITPTQYSWDKWESVQLANLMAEEVCTEFQNATYIETKDLFLDENGEPNKDFFVIDGLHLNKAGYALWTKRIKPLLL
jgi:hypothetical protein